MSELPQGETEDLEALIRPVSVLEVLSNRKEALELTLLTPDNALARTVADPDVSSPGLALAGWTGRFASGRMQVLGETEMKYLSELAPDVVRNRITALLRFDVPAIFVTKDLHVGEEILEPAREAGVPVFSSGLSTKEFYQRLKPYLETALAPTTHVHGSLADVYGVGLLFVGKSGIGKSECVLDLVERGHRLVADDLVRVSRRGTDVLLGRGHELQRHHMEIRGIGIIDVGALFGTRAIRQQKRIEVIVHLEHWDAERQYTRTGLDGDTDTILGVSIPRATVPLNPGKNITVISEVIAMNHLLKYTGVDSASAFDERLRDAMKPVREYLQEDYE